MNPQTTRRRALAAASALLLGAGTAVAVATPASALTGGAVIVSNTSIVQYDSGGDRYADISYHVDLVDDATPGTVRVHVTTHGGCADDTLDLDTTYSVDGDYTVTTLLPATGWFEVVYTASDGLGASTYQTADVEADLNAALDPANAPTATIQPGTPATSGIVHFHAGDANPYNYYELKVNGTVVSPIAFVPGCADTDIAYGPLQPGDTLDVFLTLFPANALATLALPAAADPADPAASRPSLAATGTDAGPALAVAALLVGVGGLLAVGAVVLRRRPRTR